MSREKGATTRTPPFHDLHVAVTGASGGLGQAFVREFARAGCRVTLVGRTRSVLEQIAGELGGATYVAEVDLTQLDHATEWSARAEAALGPIDVLVNNAGSVVASRFEGVSPDAARHLVDLDLLAPLLLIRAVLPGMLERRRGVIVNIASTGALGPTRGMVHYCAAKAGLAAASESLRGELRGSGVRVLTVYPGPIPTAMLRAATAGYPTSRSIAWLPTGTPTELARRVRMAIERDSARVIYPRVYWLFREAPTVTRWLLDRLTPEPLAVHVAPTAQRRSVRP